MGADLKRLLRAAKTFSRNNILQEILRPFKFFRSITEDSSRLFSCQWLFPKDMDQSWDRLRRCVLEEFLEKNGRLEELRALQTGNSEDCASLYRNEGLSQKKFLESVWLEESGELWRDLDSYLSYVRDLDTEGLQPPFKPVNSAHPANLGECRNAWSSAIYAIVVSAISLLSLVYQYLAGCVDRGGSKADSSGSLEYRDIYVAIVLFRGAYVWIKFRDVAPQKALPKGAVYERKNPRKDGSISLRYEPRFKPHKENNMSFPRIPLGEFETRLEAEIRYRIVASCYDYTEVDREVDLGDGRFFTIPELSEEERTRSGMAKVEWIKSERVPKVYAAYESERDAKNLPVTLSGANSVRPSLPDPETGSQVSGRNVTFQESNLHVQQPPTFALAFREYPAFLEHRRPYLTLEEHASQVIVLQERRRQAVMAELELQEQRELQCLQMLYQGGEALHPQQQFHQFASEPISQPQYATWEVPHLQQQPAPVLPLQSENIMPDAELQFEDDIFLADFQGNVEISD